MNHIEETIRIGKIDKEAQHRLALGRQQRISLKGRDGDIIQRRDKIIKQAEELFKEFYSTNIFVQSLDLSVDDSSVPKNSCEEVAFALKSMKQGRKP